MLTVLSQSFYLSAFFFFSFSVLSDSHLSPALGSGLPLYCGRPDGKLLSLKARDGPSFALFTLGRISIKAALSLLLPSITNSVCLCRVHFPPPAPAPFCYSKQMMIIRFFPPFLPLSISLSAVARRDCWMWVVEMRVSVCVRARTWPSECERVNVENSEQCNALYREAKAGPVIFSILTKKWYKKMV